MNHVTPPFRLARGQWRQMVWYGVSVVAVFVVLASILGNTVMDLDTLGMVYLFLFGLATGISLRVGTKRGWVYHAMRYPPGSRCVFTGRMRWGMAWRAAAVWLAGRVVSVLLLNQADSDFSLVLLLVVSIALVVAAAMYVGLRYGWHLAGEASPGGLGNAFPL